MEKPSEILNELYTFVHRGKVRDTWRLNNGNLLMMATDRISIFDFVLPAIVPKKGEVLTALTHFWLTKVLKCEHHLVPSCHDPRFNAAYDLRKDGVEIDLRRCLVVKDLSEAMYPFELILRYHIGGSVFINYVSTGQAGGHILPPNLPKWSKLEEPIFTPSTKEAVGHDINVDFNYFFAEMEKAGKGEEAKITVQKLTEAYKTAYAYAEQAGVLILDTKLETAGPILADEIFTPDSSRFSFKSDWQKAMKEGRDPAFLDKQPVRDWGIKISTPFKNKDGVSIIGLNTLKPENPDHQAFVNSVRVPEEIIRETTDRYVKIFELLTHQSLSDYQRKEMGAE